MRHSGTQHSKLKMDLQNDFTTGNNLYPKPHPQNIHLLYKYSKIVVPKMSTSEALSFAQGDGRKGKVRRGGYNKRGGDNGAFDRSIVKTRSAISAENRAT